MTRPAFTVKNFAKWLESKPAKERYDYCDPWACAAAGFAAQCGVEYDGPYWKHTNGGVPDEAFAIEDIAYHRECRPSRTYGAALKRARAYLARTA